VSSSIQRSPAVEGSIANSAVAIDFSGPLGWAERGHILHLTNWEGGEDPAAYGMRGKFVDTKLMVLPAGGNQMHIIWVSGDQNVGLFCDAPERANNLEGNPLTFKKLAVKLGLPIIIEIMIGLGACVAELSLCAPLGSVLDITPDVLRAGRRGLVAWPLRRLLIDGR
jgi:hypothetical protein